MLDFIKQKKVYILLVSILFVFISLNDVTYSMFLNSNSITELEYNTGLLDLQITEDKQIVLENAFPINDSDSVTLIPYTLKIKNTGSLPYLFDLLLVSSDEDTNTIDPKYIKVKVNNNLPNNLYVLNNTVSPNNIIYPNEEKEFKISVWLDISTPNSELGKKFSAKIVTSGSAIYKTLDTSGANYPTLKDNMIPIYYEESTSSWHIADKTNIDIQNKWYNYDEKQWANVVILKDNDKKIYDITRNNDLKVNNIKVNNGNLVIEDNYLNIGLSNYNYQYITNILRVKFDNLSNDNIYLISNANLSYYYDTKNKKFVFQNDDNLVSSNIYNLEENKWYLIGYTYDNEKVTFYINGTKIGSSSIKGKINKNNNDFKIATDISNKVVSKITIGDILFYNRILNDSEISSNYKDSISIIKDGLICGYNEFTPMTLTEYYEVLPLGTTIINDDVSAYFTWIPRYKYRVWNVLGDKNTDSYNAYEKGIEIIFENNTNSTGEIICQNNICNINDNDKFYTHPAFKYLDKELTGFWVSKYEISTEANDCNQNSQSGCTSNNLEVESKMGNTTWRNNYLSNYYKAITNNKNNYQIIKNTEWGAITYLSHSIYGLCNNNQCKNLEANSSYISGSNHKDTTTLNTYGIYDMAGGAMEYTMSNYTTADKINTLFNNNSIDPKDYELYKIDTFILGDATKEIQKNNKIWYDNTYDYENVTDRWIIRGGNNKEFKGIFAYTTNIDTINDSISTRLTIKQVN